MSQDREAQVETLIRESMTAQAAHLLTPRERALLEADLRAFLLGSPQGIALLRTLEPTPSVERSGDVPNGEARREPGAESHAEAGLPRGRR
jgi:hypothetical protein